MFPNNLIIQNTLNCYQTNSEYVKPTIWIIWWIFFGEHSEMFPNNSGMFQTSRNILKCLQTFHKVQNLSWEHFFTNIRNTLNCSQTNLEFVKQTIWFVWWIFFWFSLHLFCIYFWDSLGSPKFSVYIDSVLDPILFSVRIRVQYFSVYKMCLNSSMQLARHSFGTITFLFLNCI